jgi:hypothetical protein
MLEIVNIGGGGVGEIIWILFAKTVSHVGDSCSNGDNAEFLGNFVSVSFKIEQASAEFL